MSIDTIFFIFGGVFLIAMALAVRLFLPTLSRQFVPTPSLLAICEENVEGGLEHLRISTRIIMFCRGFILFDSLRPSFEFSGVLPASRPPYELSYTDGFTFD